MIMCTGTDASNENKKGTTTRVGNVYIER